jgi:hypothetical protein
MYAGRECAQAGKVRGQVPAGHLSHARILLGPVGTKVSKVQSRRQTETGGDRSVHRKVDSVQQCGNNAEYMHKDSSCSFWRLGKLPEGDDA